MTEKRDVKHRTEEWTDLAGVINRLPYEERIKYHQLFHSFIHDLNNALGLITNGEALTRRGLSSQEGLLPTTTELLNVIKEGGNRIAQEAEEIVSELCDQININLEE